MEGLKFLVTTNIMASCISFIRRDLDMVIKIYKEANLIADGWLKVLMVVQGICRCSLYRTELCEYFGDV